MTQKIFQHLKFRNSSSLLLISIIICTGCSSLLQKPVQKRLVVYDKVICNLDFVNNKIRQADSIFQSFGGAGISFITGFKQSCDEKDSYSNMPGGKLIPETRAITLACQMTDTNAVVHKEDIDNILKFGGKVIAVGDTTKTVTIYSKDSGGDSNNVAQPGNSCLGKEYLVEATNQEWQKLCSMNDWISKVCSASREES